MKAGSIRNPNRKAFIAIFIVTVLIVLHFIGWLRPVENFAIYITSPIFRGGNQATQSVSGFFQFLGSIGDLADENEVLKDKVEKLESENARLTEVERENKALRELSDFSAKEDFVLESAFVVGYDPTSFTEYLTIDKGTERKIEVGDPVVSQSGNLIGRVSEVGWKNAKVLLLTDSSSSVNVVVQDTRASGILKGEHGLGMVMELIPQEEVIKNGDRVVTSGLSGIFPKGLVVGEIEDVTQTENELFQEARIRPFVSFRDIEIAFVLTEF